MSTSTNAPGGAPASAARTTRKAPAAQRKQESPSDRKKKPLHFRYHTVMKPQRIYPLTVEVPTSRKDGEAGGVGTVIVVRPVIAGAQVVPAEQRLDTSEPENQVTFYVTPLARGRLPQARVEVFAPGQAPQDVPMPMKAMTQRLSWLLLVLAFVLPWFMVKITKGDWRPSGVTSSGKTEPAAVLRARVRSALAEDLFRAEIPLINEPGVLGRFTIADGVADLAETGYAGLDEGVRSNRWAPISCVLMLLLAFVSWMVHRTRKVRTRRSLNLGTVEDTASAEPATLQPLSHA
jgi:hypothetical protein